MSDYAAKVAADVAARYGVAVTPDAVRIVPRGVSADPEMRWVGNALRYVDDSGTPIGSQIVRTRAQSAGRAAMRRTGAIDPVVAARRAEVARMHAMGMTDRQMCNALGVGIHLIAADRKNLRLLPNAVGSIADQIAQDASETRARVMDMRHRGFSPAQIARALGVTAISLKAYLIDLCGPDAVVQKKTARAIAQKKSSRAIRSLPDQTKVAQAVADKQQRIADLARAGRSVTQIVAETGIRRVTIYRHLGDLGITARTQREIDLEAKCAELRARIADGQSARVITAEMSISSSYLYKLLEGMDLKLEPPKRAAQNVKTAAVNRRLDRVADMVRSGHTVCQIHGAMPEVSQESVHRYLRDLGLRAAASQTLQDAITARAAQALQLFDAGRSVSQIAAALEVSVDTVRKDLRGHGVSRSLRDASKARAATQLAARRAAYQAFVDQGLCRDDIAQALGVSMRTVNKCLVDFGLNVPAKSNTDAARAAFIAKRRLVIDTRRAQVAMLRDAGVHQYEMPARLNCSLSTVVEDLRVLRQAAGAQWQRRAPVGRHRNVFADDLLCAQVRAAVAGGRSLSWVARAHGLSQATVSRILTPQPQEAAYAA